MAFRGGSQRAVSVIFLKVTFCDFIAFFSFLAKANFKFLDWHHKENYSLSVYEYD